MTEDRSEQMAAPSIETLHEALAGLGITSAKDERSSFDRRSLYLKGDFIGAFDAHEAWELVDQLRPRHPSSLVEVFASMVEG